MLLDDLEPPVSVPLGSNKSPSSVTARMRTLASNAHARAASIVSHTSVEPKTSSIAARTSSDDPTRSNANRALSPVSLPAALSADASAARVCT